MFLQNDGADLLSRMVDEGSVRDLFVEQGTYGLAVMCDTDVGTPIVEWRGRVGLGSDSTLKNLDASNATFVITYR